MKSLGERLSAIEKREGIAGNELAGRLGVTSSDYHNKLKANDRPPTTAWRIALQFIDKYGSKAIQSKTGKDYKPKGRG